MADKFVAFGSTGEHQEWVVISRRKETGGFPVSDKHEMWETFYGEARALYVAERRTAEGYWVDAFKRVGFSRTATQAPANQTARTSGDISATAE